MELEASGKSVSAVLNRKIFLIFGHYTSKTIDPTDSKHYRRSSWKMNVDLHHRTSDVSMGIWNCGARRHSNKSYTYKSKKTCYALKNNLITFKISEMLWFFFEEK